LTPIALVLTGADRTISPTACLQSITANAAPRSPGAKGRTVFRRPRVCSAAIIPGLDATQKQVIAVLKTTPEYWHSSVDPCSPLKDYVSVATRYAVGKALRKQSRRMESAETASSSVAEMNGQTESTAARTQS
jgi:hypothetical protein